MPKFYTSNSPMKDSKSYLTMDQMTSLLNSCRNNRDRMLLTVLFRTGRRISEVVGIKKNKDGTTKSEGLRPKDINFNESLINWSILKKKKALKAIKPIDGGTLQELKSYIESNNIGQDERIFPITRQRADQILKTTAKLAGIITVGDGKYNKPHLHLLRHTFLIEAAKKASTPADLVVMKELAEHSNINTTMFYLKFNPKEQKELLEKMFK